MAYSKNEKKLKDFLKKKNDFKQSDRKIKRDTGKSPNATHIRRG